MTTNDGMSAIDDWELVFLIQRYASLISEGSLRPTLTNVRRMHELANELRARPRRENGPVFDEVTK